MLPRGAFPAGSLPGSRWGSLLHSPDFLAAFGSEEWERGMERARKRKEWNGQERKGGKERKREKGRRDAGEWNLGESLRHWLYRG